MNNKFKGNVHFIGIGAGRSGSTWISECLREHPEVNFSIKKETNFFSTPHCVNFKIWDKALNPNKIEKDITEYYKEFDLEKKNSFKKGEFTPNYLYDTEAAQLIKKHFPNTKIVVCLRNPAEIMYSTFWYAKCTHLTNNRLTTFKEFIKNEKYYEIGYLYKYLKLYYDLFPKENIYLILFDDIKKRPKDLIKNLYSYLNIDNSFTPSCLNKKINSATKPKLSIITSLVKSIYKIVSTTKLIFLYKALAKNHLIIKIYNKLTKTKFSYPPMSKDERRQTIKIFVDDIKNLEKLTGLNLSNWIK